MLTIVTGNSGKYNQIASVLESVMPCVQQSIDLIEEQTNDMFAISRSKALQAFQVLGSPVVVDDSGIFFDAYPQFPGVFSKYIFQSLGVAGLQKLFVNQEDVGAYFQCILSYMDKTVREPLQFVGTIRGTINFSFLDQCVVDVHLPYDSFFMAEGMNGVAQMDMQQFAMLHHRKQASERLKAYLIPLAYRKF